MVYWFLDPMFGKWFCRNKSMTNTSFSICYPMNLCAQFAYFVWVYIRYMGCVIMHFCTVFDWYFVLVLCLHFVYKFSTPWNKYTDPIVFPCLCACLSLCLQICQVCSSLHVVTCVMVCSWGNQALSILALAELSLLWNRQKFWYGSDLTDLHGIHDKAT